MPHVSYGLLRDAVLRLRASLDAMESASKDVEAEYDSFIEYLIKVYGSEQITESAELLASDIRVYERFCFFGRMPFVGLLLSHIICFIIGAEQCSRIMYIDESTIAAWEKSQKLEPPID